MTITDVVIVAWSTLIVLGVLAAFVSDGVRWLWRRKEVVGKADRNRGFGDESRQAHSEPVTRDRSPGAAFPTPPVTGPVEHGNESGGFEPWTGRFVPFHRWLDEEDRRFLERLKARRERCWLCDLVGEEFCPEPGHARSDAS